MDILGGGRTGTAPRRPFIEQLLWAEAGDRGHCPSLALLWRATRTQETCLSRVATVTAHMYPEARAPGMWKRGPPLSKHSCPVAGLSGYHCWQPSRDQGNRTGLVLGDGWVVEVADGRLQSVFWKMETSVISIYMSHLCDT